MKARSLSMLILILVTAFAITSLVVPSAQAGDHNFFCNTTEWMACPSSACETYGNWVWIEGDLYYISYASEETVSTGGVRYSCKESSQQTDTCGMVDVWCSTYYHYNHGYCSAMGAYDSRSYVNKQSCGVH